MACSPDALEDWRSAITSLGWSGEGFSERLEALDAYLDTVDETLDRWGEERGAS
jgi:hypothetical protein